jgi:2-hydroxychromene-2-carboxylate isomerase
MPAPARRALIDGLFAATWGGGQGIAEPAAVAAIAREAGLPETVLADAVTADGKLRVREQTAHALASGAFGVPTIFADGELFFGVDSLPHLEEFLRGEDPVTADIVERWARLPAAATRKAR